MEDLEEMENREEDYFMVKSLVDTLPYWRKRKNLPQRKAALDSASLQQLATL